MIDIIYTRHCPWAYKQKRRHFHAKTTIAKLYIYVGVEARDLYIDEGHMALDIFRFAAFLKNVSVLNDLEHHPKMKNITPGFGPLQCKHSFSNSNMYEMYL